MICIWRQAPIPLLQDIENGGAIPVLKFVCLDLVRKPDSAPFLTQVDEHAAALSGDHVHGGVELFPAVAAAGTENVAGETFAVNAGENIVLARDVAAGECEMGGVVDQGAEKMQFEMSVLVREIDGFLTDDELFRFAAVCDDVRDGDELETPFLFEFDEGIETRHLSVVVHDFADHTLFIFIFEF